MSRALLVLVTAVAVACAACAPRAPVTDRGIETWQAPELRTHALVGTIWATKDGRSITRTDLVERLAAADLVLLGEKHDNPDHHRLQALLLAELARAGRRGPVVFEMIDVDRADALAETQGPEATIDTVREAAGGDANRWDWDAYEPVVTAALAGDRRIVAGNLPRSSIKMIHTHGLAGLAPERRRALGLDTVSLTPPARAALAAEVRASHCGHATPETIEAMVAVQRARDAQLARALVDAARDGNAGAVLIAGAGHVRRDRAVPIYLEHWAPGTATAVVAFLEVAPDVEKPATTVAHRLDLRDAVDYVWFTPRVDLSDPCEEFRKQLERLRKPSH